jgi:hypothetical protein
MEITCPYCSTEMVNEHQGYSCSFCNFYDFKVSTNNGQRSSIKQMKQIVTLDHVYQPILNLFEYHTYDILLLLRLVRQERSKTYSLLSTFNKVMKEEPEEAESFKESAEEQGTIYDEITRRAWILENILIDRMGYFPERISDEMLLKVREQSLKAQQKLMKISKVQKVAN